MIRASQVWRRDMIIVPPDAFASSRIRLRER